MGTAEGMRAYSMDLRERVVAAVDRGMTQEQAAVTFGVSVNTVARYLTRRRNTGSLAPTAYRHGPRPEKKARLQAWLPARLQVAADATLTEHAAAFTADAGLVVSLATMSRALTTLPADDSAGALTPAGRPRRPGRPLASKVSAPPSATRPRAPGGAPTCSRWTRPGWCSSLSAARTPR